MIVPFNRFNIILVLLLALVPGCKTSEEREKAKLATFLRFHIETNADGTHHSVPAVIFRDKPMTIYVQRDAALDEGFMQSAELVTADEYGGFAIKVTFDATGTQRLDLVTSSYKGRRLLVHCRWTEDRFLAAPLITKRISNGVFVFTPDATREEAERIVTGLNNVIATVKRPYTF